MNYEINLTYHDINDYIYDNMAYDKKTLKYMSDLTYLILDKYRYSLGQKTISKDLLNKEIAIHNLQDS